MMTRQQFLDTIDVIDQLSKLIQNTLDNEEECPRQRVEALMDILYDIEEAFILRDIEVVSIEDTRRYQKSLKHVEQIVSNYLQNHDLVLKHL